jgi:hypothetical protein
MVVAADHRAHGPAERLGQQPHRQLGVGEVAGEQQHALPRRARGLEVLEALDAREPGEPPRRRVPRAHQLERAHHGVAHRRAQQVRAGCRVALGEAQVEVDPRHATAPTQQRPQQQRQHARQIQQRPLRQPRDALRGPRQRREPDAAHQSRPARSRSRRSSTFAYFRKA